MIPTIYPKQYKDNIKFINHLFLLARHFGDVRIISPSGHAFYISDNNQLSEIRNRSIRYRNQARRNNMMPPFCRR